jgi:hypothetical protein
VSLIDQHRQWFKARVGVDAAEIPREISLCAHAILEPAATLVVQDAATDSRFADNPLVTDDSGMRFYAGRVVNDPDGHPPSWTRWTRGWSSRTSTDESSRGTML